MFMIALKRYHTLERCNQQNFVLNTIRMIVSNAMSFYLKWRRSVNKFLLDDTKKVVESKGLINDSVKIIYYIHIIHQFFFFGK